MAIRDILTWPDPRLTRACAPVPEGASAEPLIADLFETMYAAPGRGLAAPQIGAMQRVFVMDTTWKEGERKPMCFVNPTLVGHARETVSGEEGCLSIPGVMMTVPRYAWVDIEWRDATGGQSTRRFEGFAAVCVQHEMDHLDGVVTFDRLRPDARQNALEAYDKTAGAV